MSNYKSALDKANSNAKTIEDLAGRYEELSKGVNNFGENVSLTAEEYSEYNDIVNQIADMFPTLIQGYTNEGNAILSLKGNVEQLRDAPRRRYVIEKDVNTVGIYGENTIQIVEKMQERKGRINSLPSETGFKKGYIPINQKISDAINIWLDYIGIDNYLSTPYDDLIKLSIGKDNILDVGFGISQLFPILVNNITSPYKTTTLLEQPEVHLHPKMQMNVADMLIATSKAHKNVIVETHSDHIINRIVKRIMQDESGDLRNNVKIYFFSKENEVTKLEEIKVNMVTGIEHAPKGFFEQFGNETMEITKVGLNNMRKGIV